MSKRSSRQLTPHRLSQLQNITVPSPGTHYPIQSNKTPLDEVLKPSIIEMNDSLVDLDSNVQSLQKIHESLINFNESFSAFLYGLQINAYTVEFNELPNFKKKQENMEIKEKIEKLVEYFDEKDQRIGNGGSGNGYSADDTYMTNDEDGSFIVQPNDQASSSHVQRTSKPKSKIPVTSHKKSMIGSTTQTFSGSGIGGITKATKSSERKQKSIVKKDTRPPFK